jgi:hypothetical protein
MTLTDAGIVDALAGLAQSVVDGYTVKILAVALNLAWFAAYLHARRRRAAEPAAAPSPEYDLRAQLLAQLDRAILVRKPGCTDALATPGALRFLFLSDGRMTHIDQERPAEEGTGPTAVNLLRVDDKLTPAEKEAVATKAGAVLKRLQAEALEQGRRELAWQLNAGGKPAPGECGR